jgi:hypothetical protein
MLSLNSVKQFQNMIWVFLFFFILVSFTGCSTMTDVKDTTVKATKATVDATTKLIPYVGSPDSGIIRRVSLIPFENTTIFKQLPLEKVFENMIVQYISESCSGIRLVSQGSPDFPESLQPVSSSAVFDNLTMVKKGREAGLNAIITGGILNLSLDQEDEGILWFRKTNDRLQLQFTLEVFDMESGAKIFDNHFVHEIKDMAPEEIQAFKTAQPALFASISDNLDQLAKDIAPKICNAIITQPWTGYVASVDDNQVFLPFGKSIGIKRGEILEIHDGGQVVENFNGQRFILHGKKIGEIRVTRIEEKSSTGEIISGKNIQAGNLVKYKKE